MEQRRYLTEGQIDFLNWITKHKLKKLNDEHFRIMGTFIAEDKESLQEGYLIGSMYEVRLNQIRNLYLKEYAKAR